MMVAHVLAEKTTRKIDTIVQNIFTLPPLYLKIKLIQEMIKKRQYECWCYEKILQERLFCRINLYSLTTNNVSFISYVIKFHRRIYSLSEC